jgi:hypothetical protein
MKISLRSFGFAVLAALATFAASFPAPAVAQGVVAMPVPISRASVFDFGNGPLRFKALSGQGVVFSASGTGTGTAPGTTALTLTASAAANPPCLGCIVSCPNPTPTCSIPANTTVAAFNGTTLITLSAAATVTAAVVNFGTACPTTLGSTTRAVPIGPASDVPMYTQARLCGSAAAGQPGAQILTSAVNTIN